MPLGTSRRGANAHGVVVPGTVRGSPLGRKAYLTMVPEELKGKRPVPLPRRSDATVRSPTFDRCEKRGIPHTVSFGRGKRCTSCLVPCVLG